MQCADGLVGRRSWKQQLHIQEARCSRWKSRCEKLQQVRLPQVVFRNYALFCAIAPVRSTWARFFRLRQFCFRQRLDFLRRTFQDLESGKLRRHKESLSCQKALQELNAEKNALRQKLQELDAKRELQQQLFDKFMITTRAQLELQRAEIEAIECLAAASSSELVIRSLEVVEPIKNSLAQSLAELVYEMCAHYSSFTRDSTRNV